MTSASTSRRPSQSATKKQTSIASFFTPGAVPSHRSLPDTSPSTTVNEVISVHRRPGEDPNSVPDLEDASTPKRAHEKDHNAEPDVEDEDFVLPAAKRARRQCNPADVNEAVLPRTTSLSEDGERNETPSAAGPANMVTGLQKHRSLSTRTSKYMFSPNLIASSEVNAAEIGNERDIGDEQTQQEREKLHQRFVKKLGAPDSIAEIKRRNRFITEETAEEEGGVEDDDVGRDEEASTKGSRKSGPAKKGGTKLTPMEKQVLEIKRKHPDALLVIEVGYKFRFFGEDARCAARELSIVCIPGKYRYDEHPSEAHIDRFASASIPVHRLHVHVKRLVAAGHKVGVVRQIETAALKAVGDNRNTPFVRKLTNLYTKGTYIDDVEGSGGLASGPDGGAAATGYLLCLTETSANSLGTDEKVSVGIVAVQPATGDVIYDDFEDGFMRSEIETRLLHIAPCELLIVGTLTPTTEKLVQHLSSTNTNVFGDNLRVERVERPKTIVAESYNFVSNFYAGRMKASESEEDEQSRGLFERVLGLSESVTICLSGMIRHLMDYGLEHVFDLTKYFQSFSARSHMLLNGNTLSSLEIYHNQTDRTEKGSLFWTLDRTRTKFGRRLLRSWVGRPLLDPDRLAERVDAVEELREGDSSTMVEKIKHLLAKVQSDLEKSLIRIYYGRCTRPELLIVLQTMQRIANEFTHVPSGRKPFKSGLINDAITCLPAISDDVIGFLERINPEAAKADDRDNFFHDSDETDEMREHKSGIAAVEEELDAHRIVAAAKIRKSKVNYATVAGIDYLIEVENTQINKVPASWIKISGTKKLSRFHTPDVIRLISERDQHKEALTTACDGAFASLLSIIASKYSSFRDCVRSLATLDCLLSLATVAAQPGYIKPNFTTSTTLQIDQGRHPMVEQLLSTAYVPNVTQLSSSNRALLITGPNMGGKSSYVRQVALIAIMGQIGSYVPAESATLGMLDAVFTRMGAFDNMMAGESTFMVELSETRDILKQATTRSLVIMDELGRGTSTCDGVAIAQAVLGYLVRETRCLTMFITHYQTLARMQAGFEAGALRNLHMRFVEEGRDGRDIRFLYEVGEGVAHRSYGLNVARLARLPDSVIDVAATKSTELEAEVKQRSVASLAKALSIIDVEDEQDDDRLEQIIASIEQL